MLAFSRKQVFQPRVLDVNRVVEEMRPMLERLLGEDVEVRVEPGAVGGTVRADPHQLEQAIMNLALNARDAMPGGGRLLIETACVEREGSHAGPHPEARAGRYVMLAVTDSGVGMDEATRQRIFEPFFTTKEVGQGTGLGLSAVKGVVEQSGGFIEVHSEPGRGTAFQIYLPRVEGPAADSVQPDAGASLQGKETVLVVEDLAEVREFVAEALRAYGYQAILAEDAGQALLVCERESGRIDLVLTDVVMPKVGGKALADMLRERWPGIKVLFMSGYDDALMDDGAREQIGEFIEKPFSPDQLAAKVREMLRSPDRPVRILVADDEAEVRRFLRTALEDGGYQVVEAANGKQALAEARAGGVDLVITDIVMPEQEGIETILALRKEAPSVGIIAISGAFGGQYLEMAHVLGAQAVLSKPVSAELLLAKVAEALKARR
jgi:CheY-like chemotaxis protein